VHVDKKTFARSVCPQEITQDHAQLDSANIITNSLGKGGKNGRKKKTKVENRFRIPKVLPKVKFLPLPLENHSEIWCP
jgi:hypothetical protein